MIVELPDYFSIPSEKSQEVLRLVKGDARRSMMANDLTSFETLPERWQQHDLSDDLKAALQSIHPQARGGEDLPDLFEGEVEVARMSLIDSVHGDVVSLRAMRTQDKKMIVLRLVDEYETEYALKRNVIPQALTAAEVIDTFASANPSPLETTCEVSFSSFFYSNLDSLARDLGESKRS